MIVGLGNPGERYEFSRHNIGFWVVDHLAKEWGIDFHRRKNFESAVGEGACKGHSVLLVKPLTYMNKSGEGVDKILQSFKLSPQDVLVILDDIFLPLGGLRLRIKGSSGGHKGLQSIIDVCGVQGIPRLRLGVGLPKDKAKTWADHVLCPFERDELELAHEVVKDAAEVVAAYIAEGFEIAQKRLSRSESNIKHEESK